jgi:hypothetical protein
MLLYCMCNLFFEKCLFMARIIQSWCFSCLLTLFIYFSGCSNIEFSSTRTDPNPQLFFFSQDIDQLPVEGTIPCEQYQAIDRNYFADEELPTPILVSFFKDCFSISKPKTIFLAKIINVFSRAP